MVSDLREYFSQMGIYNVKEDINMERGMGNGFATIEMEKLNGKAPTMKEWKMEKLIANMRMERGRR